MFSISSLELHNAYKALNKAQRNHRRALTVFNREQTAGQSDMSVQQTRRMALACKALNKASFNLHDCEREVERVNRRNQFKVS